MKEFLCQDKDGDIAHRKNSSWGKLI